MDITILLEEFCDENGYTFYPDYSGRYMYGSTCLGIGLGAGITPFKHGVEHLDWGWSLPNLQVERT